ncbi:MAG: T9SS type A sorting domain-containing protein [Cytophagaceae bacterium]
MKHLFTILFTIIVTCLHAQQYNWAFKIASTTGDRGMRITSDINGDLITTGYFGGTADFDPSSATSNLSVSGSGSFKDVYLSKYATSGNLKWAISFGGSDNDYPFALATDKTGSIYVGGDYTGTMHMNQTFQTGTFINSAGGRDGYVAKYDANGTFVWVIPIGGTGKDIVHGLATDEDDNIYVTGYFGGTVDFDPSSAVFNLISNGGRDIFLAKYDATGKFKWAFNMGGTMSTAYEEGGQDLVVRGNEIYLTGNFEGNVDFNPSNTLENKVQSNGLLDIFLAKYDTAGNYIWAIGAGCSGKHDFSFGVDVDASGNAYITGGFEQTVDFDPNGGVAQLTAPSNARDIFVAKYTGDGAYVWAFQIGGSSVVHEDGFDIDVAGSDLYLTGSFWGPADFDPSQATATRGVSNNQAFVAKYTTDGTFRWAFDIGSTSVTGPADNGFGIVADNNGSVFVTGDFYGNADFDPHPVANVSLSGGNTGQAFIASYNGSVSLSASGNSDALKVNLYPNPANAYINIDAGEKDIESLQVVTSTGELLYSIGAVNNQQTFIDIQNYKQGIYFLKVKCKDHSEGKFKFVVY